MSFYQLGKLFEWKRSNQHYGCTRQWLYWYDRHGNALPTSDDIIAQERQIAQQERLLCRSQSAAAK